MATVVVVFSSTGFRIDDAESLTPANGAWASVGNASKVALEPDFFYQGSNCASSQVSNKNGGPGFNWTGTPHDYETTPRTVIMKGRCATPGAIGTGTGGYNVEVGSGGARSAYYTYHVLDNVTYQDHRGWIVTPVDPNLLGYPDVIVSTPDPSIIEFYAIGITTVVGLKGQNQAVDAIDYVENGVANLLLTRGDSTDADGTFQDFIDFDFDFDDKSNRYGIIIEEEGVLFIVGIIGVGESGTATEFTDSNKTLIWPDGRFDTAFAGLIHNLENASTVVGTTDCTYIGRGSRENIQWFDTALDVDGTNEEVDIVGHGFVDGDYVLYSDEGGTAITGLTDATSYWVNESDTTNPGDSISFYNSRADALSDTSPIGLTADSAPGANHKLTKVIDTRPTITYVGTSGIATAASDVYNNIDNLVLTSVVTLTNCKMLNSGNITAASGATISGLTLSFATLDEGVAALIIDDLDDLSLCNFTFNDEGHAIEVTDNTGSPFDWDHDLSGYWTPEVTPNNGWEFSTAQAFTSEQLNTDGLHGFTTGDAVFYNDESGIENIGLVDGDKYYVNVADTDTVTVHLTKSAAIAGSSAINLTTSGSETHALYSSKAAVFNNSVGAITINVNAGSTPSVRNGTGASSTVVASVPITITCKNSAGLAVEGIRVRVEEDPSGSLVTEGSTNASGIFSDSFSGSTPQAVKVIARLKGFKFNEAFDSIASGTGLSVPFTMIRDQTVNRP